MVFGDAPAQGGRSSPSEQFSSHSLAALELQGSPNDQMVSCRLAMRTEMKAGDLLLVAEDNAAGMTVRYVLPRTEH